MKLELTSYNHDLEGKILVRDNGNWSVNGRWYKDYYVVRDSVAVGVERRHFWNNVSGNVEPLEGVFPIEVIDDKLEILGVYSGDLPTTAKLKPVHTCGESVFHEFRYSVESKGKEFVERYSFCRISEARQKWEEFKAEYAQHGISLVSVTSKA